MKNLFLGWCTFFFVSSALSQNPINLDIQVEGPDPCTGEYTFINNSTGTAVDAGTVIFTWSGPWTTSVETTDLNSPPNVVLAESSFCNDPQNACFGQDYTVVAIDNVSQTAVAVNVSDALHGYDPPSGCIALNLINADEDSIFCIGDTLIFEAGTAGSFYNDFNWDASSLGDIVSGQGTNTITVVVTSDEGGKVVVEDAAGCGVSTFMVLDSEDCCTPVTGEFTYIQPNPCIPSVEFTDLSTGEIDLWEWDFGDGHFLSSQGHLGSDLIDPSDDNGGLTSGTYANPIHNYSTLTGPYSISIQLVVYGPNLCSASAEIIFDNYFGGPSPVTADIDINQPDPCSPVVYLTDESTGDVAVWHWDFGDGFELHSNGHLGTDPVDFADNNGGLTSGTYANPIHDYSSVLNPSGMDVELLVESDGGCYLSAVIASDQDFFGNCCENGILGLKDFTLLNYGIYNPQNVYDFTASNTCVYNPASLNRGGSTIDADGNYFYANGSSIVYQERNGGCINMTFTAPAGWTEISEPEFVASTNTVLFTAFNGTEYVLAEMATPALFGNVTSAMNIVQTIALGTVKPSPGSSTLEDGNDVNYYFMDNAYSPSALNDAGDLYIVDVANASVALQEITDMEAYNQANSTLFSATNTTIIEELEYNPSNNRIYAVVRHLVNIGTGNTGTNGPGGGNVEGPIDGPGSGPGGGVLNPGGGNEIDLNNTAIFVYRSDIMEVNINSGNAMLHIENVSYDGKSSSTFDEVANNYYLTANDGALMYVADLSAASFTTQQSISPDPKNPTQIFEIEWFDCQSTTNGARTSGEETNESTLDVMPNPSATGRFSVIEEEKQTNSIEVINSYGAVVRTIAMTDGKADIDLSNLAKGMYFVRSNETSEMVRIVYH